MLLEGGVSKSYSKARCDAAEFFIPRGYLYGQMSLHHPWCT